MQTLETKKVSLNPALKSFWTTKARNKVLYGGRASSKSWDAAGVVSILSNEYNLRVLCVRQIQNKIEQSVYSLLKIQIERFGLSSNFKILDNKIVNTKTGSEFMFYGLWRHITEIKSLESIDILWIEEAHALTPLQWEILEPTIRKEDSECWILFNPDLVTDFVYENFVVNPPPDTIVRKINYLENPFLSKTILKVIAAAKERDPDKFKKTYLGEPDEDGSNTIIKRAWIKAAIDAHKKLGFPAVGARRIGFDIADSGDDNCATVCAHGSIAYTCEEWHAKEDELIESYTKVYRQAEKENLEITYDAIGVGAAAGSKFKEINATENKKISYQKFVASDGVIDPTKEYEDKILNKDFFLNIKAQAWWQVADRFKNTYNAVEKGMKFDIEEMISISSDMPNLEKLIKELSSPKAERGSNNLSKVESKDDMKKRGIPSPNIADAFIMAFSPTSNKVTLWDVL